MELSVITTLYKSKPFLGRFLSETIATIQQLNINSYELVFVNDGSPDDSVKYLLERKMEIPQIKIMDLSRNFGHHYAIQAGLRFCQGKFIFLIDNDLETSPAILQTFYNELQKTPSLDVVYGFQDIRKGSFIEKKGGALFWSILNKMSDVKIPHNILTERLMSYQYVQELLRMQDANLFMGGLMHWTGFEQKGIPVIKGIRDGESTYSLKKRMQLMFQAVTSFSAKPLEWLFYFGIIISLLSFIFILYLFVDKLIHKDAVELGWTSIIALNVLVLGILSTFLGIIGIYVSKIFRQVQGRPNYIIKKIYE
ncbi:MAG: glycosyltransferase family 2 protein [Bacteroidia bacterium]